MGQEKPILLIVSDNGRILFTTARFAARVVPKYNVCVCSDKEDVVHYIASMRVKGIIVIFQRKPIDGIELIHTIALRWPKLAMLLLTENPAADEHDAIECTEWGAVLDIAIPASTLQLALQELFVDHATA